MVRGGARSKAMTTDELLKLTLGELLERLLARPADDGAGWVNIRDERWPWRRIVAAAQRGECQVSKVGRQLLMRREELGRWLDLHRIRPAREQPTETSMSPAEAELHDILRSSGRRRRKARTPAR